MTQPSEEQVRAWLKQSADEFVMFAQVSRGHGLEDDARRYEGTEHLPRAAGAPRAAGRKARDRSVEVKENIGKLPKYSPRGGVEYFDCDDVLAVLGNGA